MCLHGKGELRMKIKKGIAGFLVISMLSLFSGPMATTAQTTTEKQSLYEFIQTTDNIQGSYKYPSMKISSNTAGKSLLPAHTPIIIRCEETISTRGIVSGGMVNFSVVSDVKDSNDNVLIKAGTPVTAQITFAKSKDMIGRSGEVTVEDFHTTAVDGTYIPLSGSVSAKPDDKMTMSIVLSVLICPLFLLIKGEEAQVPAGTTKTAYTVSDVYIKPIRL